MVKWRWALLMLCLALILNGAGLAVAGGIGNLSRR